MSDLRLLVDKVAVITGAANGIGAATAELFSEHGAVVYIADIDTDHAESLAASVNASGGEAVAVTTDVRDLGAVERLHSRVIEGHGRCDVLVNNAGHWVAVKDLVQGDPAHWQALYEINLLHIFAVTHAFLPAMLEQGSGAIVNVSSIEGVRGYPQDPVYSAFKAAVLHFTRSLGVDVAGRGVRVNAIAPDPLTACNRTSWRGIRPSGPTSGPNGYRWGGWACRRIRPGSSCSWPASSPTSWWARPSTPMAGPGRPAGGTRPPTARIVDGPIGPSMPEPQRVHLDPVT